MKTSVRRFESEKAVIELFGYSISDKGLEENVDFVFNTNLKEPVCRYMACANPHSLVVASRDQKFATALREADLLIPDGTGVVLAARILCGKALDKVAGSDFFLRMCEIADKKGNVRFFFLGSTEDVLNCIKIRLNHEFPNVLVCGTYSPPFGDKFTEKENCEMVNAVNRARPDFLWVGMTAPKQEKWILANRETLKVPFAAAVGAVFDFYAGSKKRSSELWIKLGLEWLPRFIKEPKRLWKRNLKSTPVFLWWILAEKMRR